MIWREKYDPSNPPLSLNAICRGGSPLPSPPAPGAYTPLTGADCGAPLELIMEMVVVEWPPEGGVGGLLRIR